MGVVDAEMRPVPADGETMGEVVMRGNIVMKGYYDDAEATKQAFTGGWFHSGDIAVRHPDGSIELRDRKKDIIISGGENISTVEVRTGRGVASRRHGVCRHFYPAREMGRSAEGLRHSEAPTGGLGDRNH